MLAIVPRCAAPAAAPPGVVTLAAGVSAEATAENSQRKLLVDGQGRLLLAYVRPVGGVDQVFLAESADGGRSWRRNQVTSGTHPARLPSLALAADGSLHLVWTEYVPIGRILYRVRRGGRWTPPGSLSAAGVYAGIPVVVLLAGRAHVLWYGILPERPSTRTRHGSVYEIVYTRQDRQAWTAPLAISPGIPDSLNPALAPDRRGRLHAAWYQFDSRVYQVRYARYDGRWSLPRTRTGGPAEHTAVALDTAGSEVHLVWVQHGATRRVMYGTLEGPPTAVAGPGAVNDPVIAAGDERVIVAWREGERIMVRSVRPSGPPLVLGRGSGSPAMAFYRGTAFVAWTATAGTGSELRFAAVSPR